MTIILIIPEYIIKFETNKSKKIIEKIENVYESRKKEQ